MIRLYMDESGTHDGSPYVTVAAYAGQPKHWKAFTTAWNAAKRPDGIEVYHAVDCANQRNEFEGWSKPACNSFAAKMIPIIATHPPVGVVIGINMVAFNEAMASHPDLRKMVGTPYACCFQWVVQKIVSMLEQYGSNERLAFFHEQNDYQTEAHDAFNWITKNRERHGAEMSLTFGTKGGYTPLQAADVLAYEASKRMQGIDAARPARRAWTALDPKQDRITMMRYGRDNMHLLIRRLSTVQQEIETFGRPITFLNERSPPKRSSS